MASRSRAALLVATSPIPPATPGRGAARPIRVGVPLSSTGPAACTGIPQHHAPALLPEAVGDRRVEWAVLDDGSDAPRAVANPRKLAAAAGIDAVIGPCTSPGALAAVAAAAGRGRGGPSTRRTRGTSTSPPSPRPCKASNSPSPRPGRPRLGCRAVGKRWKAGDAGRAGLPLFTEATGTVPVGFPREEAGSRHRRPLERLVHWNGDRVAWMRPDAGVRLHAENRCPFATYRTSKSPPDREDADAKPRP